MEGCYLSKVVPASAKEQPYYMVCHFDKTIKSIRYDEIDKAIKNHPDLFNKKSTSN